MSSLLKYELIVYDCDGVLTDNRVYLSENGLETVAFCRSDGMTISFFKKLGLKQIIITAETNKVVAKRADKLDIPLISGVDDKQKILKDYCKVNGINLENVIYVGNDINDLEIMKIVGHPYCPIDASEEIKKISKKVLKTKGGYGVIRELYDILKEN
ncbi:MAG: HAD hydrolase family protein [Pseudomonadota bacterium]